MKNWQPPEKLKKITTIDAHTAGEPFRIITSGIDEPPGDTILEKRKYAVKNLDYLRKVLMWEPRGHADMYGCIVTKAVTKEADFGVLFMHNEGFSTMCGHGIIGIATIAIETGFIKAESKNQVVKIDTPAGLVTATAHMSKNRVESVSFQNVPSFALVDNHIDVPSLGRVNYDLGFGGAFYAFVNAADLGLKCSPDFFPELVKKGMEIKRAIMEKTKINHPFEDDLSFLYGTIFIEPADKNGIHSKHVCIFAEGEVDRSPTGTGVSARLAILHQKGEIIKDQKIMIQSIIKSSFSGKVVLETNFGPFKAVIPEVKGSAYITGRHEFLIDPDDPLKQGFVLR
ncbi:MAG: proline racemase family protein [Thermodesulfobacteriota bacterium]|nr:proline racemase family protein [Thermodesulfobacteriota bacterium]